MRFEEKKWLGDQDSNLDRQSQSLLSCRWTIPQKCLSFFIRRPKGFVKGQATPNHDRAGINFHLRVRNRGLPVPRNHNSFSLP